MSFEYILGLIFQPAIWLFILVVVILRSSIKFVPHNRTYVIERFGKFRRVQEAGLNFIIPFIDSVAADRSLKEQAVDVPSQSAITKDNISLSVDGVLYFRVLDPYKATYGVDDYAFAVIQLAQTTMRSELGKMELDKTFEERDLLNTNIVAAINQASSAWGVQVLRYEIKDIVPPQSVMQAMEAQMRATWRLWQAANRVGTSRTGGGAVSWRWTSNHRLRSLSALSGSARTSSSTSR